jgi:hypothetical protein
MADNASYSDLMITIPKHKTPESVLRKTRIIQKIAGGTITIGLFAYPISLFLVNAYAPETLSTGFLGDKSDPISNMVFQFVITTIPLSIILLGIANRINYHYAAKNDPNVSRTKLITVTLLSSIGWVTLSLVSIVLLSVIFLMMRLSL